jgi:hypothetical protein
MVSTIGVLHKLFNPYAKGLLMVTVTIAHRAGRREWVALAVLALPLLLVSMDVSILYFAVPQISRDLNAGCWSPWEPWPIGSGRGGCS